MRVKTKMVHALPFTLSLHVVKRINTDTRTMSSKVIHRAMVESRSPVTPVEREREEAQGRNQSELRKMTQLLEQLLLSSQSGDFPGASSFYTGPIPTETRSE